jgi:hypothetical protein
VRGSYIEEIEIEEPRTLLVVKQWVDATEREGTVKKISGKQI